MSKCSCGKELTEHDVCPIPSGRPCEGPQVCVPPRTFATLVPTEGEDGQEETGKPKALSRPEATDWDAYGFAF